MIWELFDAMHGDEGFGVVETIIACLVLALVILGLAPLLEQSGSATTGQAAMQVTGAGIARQYLNYYQEQLDKDVQDAPASNSSATPSLFPYPFTTYNAGSWSGCASLGSPAAPQSTANSFVLCPGGSTWAAQVNGADQAMAANPSLQYAWCPGVTNPVCGTTSTVVNANCNSASLATTGTGYCVWITGDWQCEPAQYSDNLNAMPQFYVQVEVTWTNEIQTQPGTATPYSPLQGSNTTTLSLMEAPPSSYVNSSWWTNQDTGYNQCNSSF